MTLTHTPLSDNKHRQMALDPSQSFIVQAPAGSGKTTLLILRYLTLLQHVKKPEEILAITFTNKAAHEMRQRILSALHSATHDAEPTSDHHKETWLLARAALLQDKKYGWNLINNPNQLRIQTIDSFCSYLTKQLPLLSHFGSPPAILPNPIALYEEAVTETLSLLEGNSEWSTIIASVLAHLDNNLNKLRDLLMKLLAKRDQWLSYIYISDDQDTRQHLEENISHIVTEKLHQLHQKMPKTCIEELCDLARFAADNLILHHSDSPITACRDMLDIPPATTDHLAMWLGIRDLLLTADNTWRKQHNINQGFPSPTDAPNKALKSAYTEHKSRIKKLISQLQDTPYLQAALEALSWLPTLQYSNKQWELLQCLLKILKLSAAHLRITFQQHGHIDFIENSLGAILALGDETNPTNLALALDYQIQHILVDEFQDTSFTQYRLLEKLVQGWTTHDHRTLFIVGDPMQSIYRFREAEVGLFLRMQQIGIGHIQLVPLTLTTNFRSDRDIVEWNNQTYRTVFPENNDLITGAVAYSASVPIDTSSNTNHAVSVINADPSEQANKIIEIVQSQLLQSDQSSICILARARSHLVNIIALLKKAKIPYQAIEIEALTQKQIILDLYSLTCALLQPADKIAWMSILRAPWCGLSLTDLQTLAGHDFTDLVYEQLLNIDVISRLSPEGQVRLNRILPVLKQSVVSRKRYPLRTWIENTWIALGGPACCKHHVELDDANTYFDLLDTLYNTGETMTADTIKTSLKKLYATPRESSPRVQLMTIHSAKGLEFDCVVVPHLERATRPDDKALITWVEHPLNDGQPALLLAPIHSVSESSEPIYEFIDKQHKMKISNEICRLLYVATTRAKKQLVLLFSSPQEKNAKHKNNNSFLDKLRPSIIHHHENVVLPIPTELAQHAIDRPRRKISRLPLDWTHPNIQTSIVEPSMHQQPGGFTFTSPTFKRIGTCVHQLLCMIANHGIHWWQNMSDDMRDNYIKRNATQLGIHFTESAAINKIHHAIQNTLQHERGKWLLNSHIDAHSEYPITALIDNTIHELVIDRTFVDEVGIRWIIDYKTSMPEDQDIAAFIHSEYERYLSKMQQYAHAFRGIENRETRLALFFPNIPEWKEWRAS